MPSYLPRHAAPTRARRHTRAARPAAAAPRHASGPGPRSITRGLGIAMTGVLAFVLAGAPALTLGLFAGVAVSDVDALLADREDRPVVPADPDDPFAGSALNILVMGTDYRGGGNAMFAGDGHEFASDTTLLVHVAGDRSHVEVVSIPRDSLVEIPACPLPDGGQSRARRSAMFNSAFAIGGGPGRDFAGAAACTILTVEHNTGVRVTDHVIVMMNGVIGVVDAIGGVPLYLPEPVRGDRHVNLDLPAGDVRLDGDQAINFLRARGGHGLGLELGSDLARITRQQKFLDAMTTEILDQNLIASAPRLIRLAEAVLASISPGRSLAGPTELAGLGWSLRGLDPAQIALTELPVVPAPHDPNRVVWVRGEADAIWARIIAGEPPPGLVAPDEPDEPETVEHAWPDVTGAPSSLTTQRAPAGGRPPHATWSPA